MYKHEQKILSWWLVHPSDAKATQLTVDHFSHPEHVKAAHVLMSGGSVFDVCGLDVFDRLQSQKVLKHEAPKAERALMENFAVKASEAACAAFLKSVRSDDRRNLQSVQQLVRALHEAEAMGPVRSRTHGQVAAELLEVWLKGIQESKEPDTLPFPWPALQAHTGGLPLGKLVLIGGRSSEHKTTVARAMAAHLAEQGHRTVFWTLEDSEEDIAGRTIASGSRILTTKALSDRCIPATRTGITADDMSEILGVARGQIDGSIGSNLRYIDRPNPRLASILGEIKAEAARGTRAFFGDFLQLVRTDSIKQPATNDWWREAVAAFAGLAKSLEILIVWTSQIEKTATKESAAAGRVPQAVEMPFGAVLRQGAYGCLMVGLQSEGGGQSDKPISDGGKPTAPQRKHLLIEVDKWKSAANVGQDKSAAFVFDVDPAHDRLIERKRK